MNIRKIFIVYLLLLIFNISCRKSGSENENKPIEIINENIEITFNLMSGGFLCYEFCGSVLNTELENGLKSKYPIPDSIVNKFDWWNRTYIGTLKFTGDTCTCKFNWAEPYPPGSTDYPISKLKIVEILDIREK